ncbi:MAG TPA: MFS transporter [Patescibacteria group bacterium]|nr:MFS transporter [Patescibacteria group bacterium]
MVTNWRRNVRVFTIDSIFQWFLVSIGVWVLIWRTYLSFTEITLIMGVGLLVGLLLELPSGALADLIGRKKTVIIGRVFGVIGFSLYSFADNFWLFLLAAIFYHANWAFESGALSALLYDSLKENGKEKEWYQKTESNTFFLCTIGMAAASILGGFLFRYDIHLPYVADVIVSVGALIGVFYLEEPTIDTKKFTFRNYIRQNIEGATHIVRNKLIGAISLFSIIINFIAYVGLWYLYEPRLAEGGFAAASLGYLVAGTYLIRAVGTKLIPAVTGKLSDRHIPLFLAGVQTIGSGLSYLEGRAGAISSVYMRKFSDGFRKPILARLQNDQMDSRYRATALSAIALCSNILISIAGLFVGKMQDSIGSAKTLGMFFWIGLVTAIPAAGYLYSVIRRKEEAPQSS